MNVPFLDEWTQVLLLQLMHAHRLTFSAVWLQHNENRMLFPNLVYVELSRFTPQYDIWMMRISLLTMCVGVLGIVHLVEVSLRKILPFGIVRGLAVLGSLIVLFELGDYENILWAFQFAWFLIFATVAWSFVLVESFTRRKKNSWLLLVGLVVLGAIASFSSLQGLLVWPSVGVMFAAHWVRGNAPRRRRALIGLLTSVVSFVIATAVYLLGFQMSYLAGATSTTARPSLLGKVEYFLVSLTAPLGALNSISISDRYVIGVVVLLFGVSSIVWMTLAKNGDMGTVGWMVFALLFYVLVTLGRNRLGLSQALSSRYSLYGLPYYVFIVVVLLRLVNVVGTRLASRLRSSGSIKFAGGVVSVAISMIVVSAFALESHVADRSLIETAQARSSEIVLLKQYPKWNTAAAQSQIYPDLQYVDPLVGFWLRSHVQGTSSIR